MWQCDRKNRRESTYAISASTAVANVRSTFGQTISTVFRLQNFCYHFRLFCATNSPKLWFFDCKLLKLMNTKKNWFVCDTSNNCAHLDDEMRMISDLRFTVCPLHNLFSHSTLHSFAHRIRMFALLTAYDNAISDQTYATINSNLKNQFLLIATSSILSLAKWILSLNES